MVIRINKLKDDKEKERIEILAALKSMKDELVVKQTKLTSIGNQIDKLGSIYREDNAVCSVDYGADNIDEVIDNINDAIEYLNEED